MNDEIREGDYVLLYLDDKRTYMVRAESGKVLHTHKGFVRVDDLIGKEFGAHVKSNLGAEFIAFKPSIRDYILKSSRGTQIIYPKDIALIILFGNIQPGSHVVEAGTGTGALTTALATYVKPSGRVYSYEVRREFLEIARRNLERAGVLEYVELKNKDITLGIDESNVDSVVLDMATPWLIVPHAHRALKGSGTFISFSPTIDQVMKTVEELKINNFANVETIECLIRKIRVEKGKTRPETLMTGHTGYIVFARKASSRTL
ncbi:MAG: tRNA (adenine-N1)-methyltransferase [Candidatus Bathyarchaeota archaeon]|nr:tRNA (adenine-N1)-methyltransferase [Candidatus Bathyarchaeota archaeon]